MVDNKDAHLANQALLLWLVFLIFLVIVNGTIPFVLGFDLHEWTYSKVKLLLFGPVFYVGLFLVAPLILNKGWKKVSEISFLIPLVIAIVGSALWVFFPYGAVLIVVAIAYLHWRFDLSDLGIRSKGWKGDFLAIVIIGLLMGATSLLSKVGPLSLSLSTGISAGLIRLFGNPASTTENMFYFGFLTERLSKRFKTLTPLLIGFMYTIHEMSNPEYWYAGVSFGFIFVGVTFFAFVYLWRRSVVAIWLGDGLGRLISNLF